MFIKYATATWFLRFWPICRRCCRVLAAKKQEQMTNMGSICRSANIASLHWKAGVPLSFTRHVLMCRVKKCLFTSDVLWYWSSRRSSLIQAFLILKNQRSRTKWTSIRLVYKSIGNDLKSWVPCLQLQDSYSCSETQKGHVASIRTWFIDIYRFFFRTLPIPSTIHRNGSRMNFAPYFAVSAASNPIEPVASGAE